MGKPIGKKKPETINPGSGTKPSKGSDKSSKAFDEDTAIFINMAQELKDEGYKLFQKNDHDGAMLKYEKALKLLPNNHIDVASLRTNMATCYMQMGLGEFPRAISECNLALDVAPKYSKALLRRAKCFEGLNKFELAWRDVSLVLNMEPNNQSALEISEGLKKIMEEKGIKVEEIENAMAPEITVSPSGTPSSKTPNDKKILKEKSSKKKKKRRSLGVEDALEISDDFKKIMEEKGINVEETKAAVAPETILSPRPSFKTPKENKITKKSSKKRRSFGVEDTKRELFEEKVELEHKPQQVWEKKVHTMHKPQKSKQKKRDFMSKYEQADEDKSKPEDKEVVQEKVLVKEDRIVTRTVKLVFGDDIRCAQLPINCSVLLIKDVVLERFPNLKAVLVKYSDREGDLITITTTDELRKAERSCQAHGSLRLYVSAVTPDQEPAYDGLANRGSLNSEKKVNNEFKNEIDSTCIDSWIIQFAQLFKNHVGFDSESYLDLHEAGMKMYSEAIEDTISSEDAQELFDMASDKFQEMAALALFNMGNVHMSKAKKQVPFSEDNSSESIHLQINSAFEWAKKEYTRAGMRYEEALKIKPDFYEGHLALGQQQFEQAKLSWHYSQRVDAEIELGVTQDILLLYNKAEDNMEAGMQIWEEMEERRLNGLSKEEKYKAKLQKLGLDGLLRDLPANEASEQASIMRSQIYILWGTLLYERSVMEFKLGLPSWEECLEVAVEKFELAGTSHTDITVMIKNHCSSKTAPLGLGFKIDEIVQAWHEMYDAKRWQLGVPSFRLEPLFRRRVPRLYQILEHL